MNLFILIPAVLLLLIAPSHSRYYYRSNICAVVNKKPRCCMGWALDETNLHCTQPVCTGECEVVGGRCINPDTCLCPGGYVAFSCYVGKRQRAAATKCNIRCMNGGTCQGDKCLCEKRFSGNRCEIATCPNSCSKRGECQSDGKCKCDVGFSGEDCSEEKKAPCFLDVSRGLCRREIKGRLTTMEVCCNSIGAAWGSPCKKCAPSRCRNGYSYRISTSRCEDIDECKEITGVCRGGTCENTDGKYACTCSSGMVYDPKKLACVAEFDKCTRNPRICGQGQCIAKAGGGYRCKCNSGYMLSADGKKCESRTSYLRFDMCHYNRGYLCTNGECVPHGRSYRCRCNRGFQSTADGRSCKKVENFCKLYESRVCTNGICVPIGNNDYRCKCNEGYELSVDQRSCISTCERFGDSLCKNGQCVSSRRGGYACKCNKGYYQTLNQKMCVRAANDNSFDANVMRTVCELYTLCSNGRCLPIGKSSYRCKCNSGYESSSDGKSCNEVKPRNRNHVCDLYADYYCPNAKCIKIGHNYRCECPDGYEWKNRKCQSKPSSVKARKGVTNRNTLDESANNYCKQYTYLCENGQCIPTSNYFYCECNPGYTAVDDRRRCRKDETKPAKLVTGFYDFCQHYKSECRGGTCHNEPTTFWCKCTVGYRWDALRLQCVLDKKRQLVSDQWSAYASGRQKPFNWRRNNRWYFSACKQTGREVCGKGYCVDKGSSFECRCYEGYEQTQHKKRCVDINECDRDPSVCWQGQCVNTPGSYSCRCLKGYKLSHVNRQPMCVDRNECEEGNPCLNGACRNLWGSYKCVCYDGYKADETGQQCLPSVPYHASQASTSSKGKSTNRSKKANAWSDLELSDSKDYVNNCSLCAHDCEWISNGKYQCKCPEGLISLGKSDVCVEDNSVMEYTFDIQMDDATQRRRKRSIPDRSAAAHLRARIVLRRDVNLDHFANSMTGLFPNTDFYKIVRIGDIKGSNGTHSVIDLVFI